MMWLSKNTEVWIAFPLKNGKLMPVICEQVTQCLGSLTFSLVSTTGTNYISTMQRKRIMDHTKLHASIR